MSELIERAKAHIALNEKMGAGHVWCIIAREMIAEMERLEAEIARLKEPITDDAIPHAIFTYPVHLSDAEFDRARRQFQERYGKLDDIADVSLGKQMKGDAD